MAAASSRAALRVFFAAFLAAFAAASATQVQPEPQPHPAVAPCEAAAGPAMPFIIRIRNPFAGVPTPSTRVGSNFSNSVMDTSPSFAAAAATAVFFAVMVL